MCLSLPSARSGSPAPLGAARGPPVGEHILALAPAAAAAAAAASSFLQSESVSQNINAFRCFASEKVRFRRSLSSCARAALALSADRCRRLPETRATTDDGPPFGSLSVRPARGSNFAFICVFFYSFADLPPCVYTAFYKYAKYVCSLLDGLHLSGRVLRFRGRAAKKAACRRRPESMPFFRPRTRMPSLSCN